MSCFLGHFTHIIDSQRRVAIPRDWRSLAADDSTVFYLLPGRDQSIQVLPKELFESVILEKTKQVSFANAAKSKALTAIGSKAARSVCDRQGRITLTPYLMEYASLTNEAVMVGSVNSICILSPPKWEQAQMSNDEMLDQIERIMEAGEIG